MVEGWPQADFRGVIRLFTEDVEMSAYQPEGVLAFRGREEVVDFMNEFGSHWDPYLVEVEEVREVGRDLVLVSGRQIGTGRTSGLEISEPLHVAIRLRDGRIAAHHWHVEREKALSAAGL